MGNPALFQAPPPAGPATPAQSTRATMPKYPIPRSASETLPKRRPPPYGLAITDCDARSDRSRVTVRPRYSVPLKPKLKPMDHWDMIVAFDAAKHMEEEETFERSGRLEVHARFRAVLDAQMDELREVRDAEAANKRK